MEITKINNVYIENHHKIKSKKLEVKLYAQAIESLIVVCADIVIINKKERLIYLAERSVKPMQGFWSIGGRRFAGDPLIKSIKNNFLRETSVNISADRFKYLCTKEVIWENRKEIPQEVGKHDLIQFCCVELSSEELHKASSNLCKDEYSSKGLVGFDKNHMKNHNAHPIMIEIYDKIFS